MLVCLWEYKVKIDFDTSYLLFLHNPGFNASCVLCNFPNRTAENTWVLRMYMRFSSLILRVSFQVLIFNVSSSVR